MLARARHYSHFVFVHDGRVAVELSLATIAVFVFCEYTHSTRRRTTIAKIQRTRRRFTSLFDRFRDQRVFLKKRRTEQKQTHVEQIYSNWLVFHYFVIMTHATRRRVHDQAHMDKEKNEDDVSVSLDICISMHVFVAAFFSNEETDSIAMNYSEKEEKRQRDSYAASDRVGSERCELEQTSDDFVTMSLCLPRQMYIFRAVILSHAVELFFLPLFFSSFSRLSLSRASFHPLSYLFCFCHRLLASRKKTCIVFNIHITKPLAYTYAR
jgi:hypothetical protein